MTAKDRFCGEWGAQFPEWPPPVWALQWPDNEDDVRQLIEQCAKRVAQLQAELERERFSLNFLSSFNGRQRASLMINHSPCHIITSEDIERNVDPASGLSDMETVVNGTTNDAEMNVALCPGDATYPPKENEYVKSTGNSSGEGGTTREKQAHNSEALSDDEGELGDTMKRRPTLGRQGAFRRFPCLSSESSPAISPRPSPRSGSAFPVTTSVDPEERRRSLSTGNLPTRNCLDATLNEVSHSADGSPTTQIKSSNPVTDFTDYKKDDEEEANDDVIVEANDQERRDSKGHRPRSMNLGSKAAIRDTLKRKKLSCTQSDSSLPSSVSTKPVEDERPDETKDVILVLPENAILASPSEDIFNQSVIHKDTLEETVPGSINLSDRGLEPVNLTSPDHFHEVTVRAADMSNRESCFLDLSNTDGTLPHVGSSHSVQLDEVSMAIYDDYDDDFLDSDDGDLYSSYSENEESEDRVFGENEERQEEETVCKLAVEDSGEEPHREIQGEENKDGTRESPTSEDVICRRRARGSPSPRRTCGISPEDWTKLQGEMEQDPQLAQFYQSQLLVINKQEEEEVEPDGSTVSVLPGVSSSPSLSPRVRSPSPAVRQSSDDRGLALRKMIVSTFLDKEYDYIDHLNLICQHYHKPLAALATTSQPMLSSRDCDVVFYKQEDLLRIHRQLSESIEGRLTQWSSHQTVAGCFGILVDALPLYKSYFENYKTAVELLMKRKTELPQFAYFVDSATKMKSVRHRVPLEELLRKPVDKLQNYSLVLKDLVKYTPRDHGDFDLLLKTSQAVTDLLKSINQGPTDTEGKQPLKSEVVVQLTENGRKFRQLCLFEDVLLCVKQKGSGRQRKYECKWYLPLTELTFHPPPETEVPGPISLTSHQELESLSGKIGKLKYDIRQEQTDKRKGGKSSSKLDKMRKKLRELEASLRLNKAGLPLRLFDVEGRAYTLLFCQEPARYGWQDAIASTRETAKPVQLSPYDLDALIRRSRRSLRKSDSIRSVVIEADVEEEFLTGILHIQVHSAKGIIASRQGKPDLFCTLLVDCYGRFDRKAKTHVVKESLSPAWEQEFDIEVEGAQSVKIACCDRRNMLMEDICGRGQVELLKLGVKNGRRHTVDVKLMPRGSVKLSVTYSTGLQSLSRKLSVSDSGIFGIPIGVLCQRERTRVPLVVTFCCEEIERRGLDEVGIYRVSGVASDVMSLKQAFERDTAEGARLAAEIDIHAVSGLVKMFFRELPEPLFTNELYPRLVDGIALGEPEAKKRIMASLVHALPPINLETTLYLFRHLRRVASEERVNKMSLNNLSTVFGPNLLRPAMGSSDYAAIAAMSHVGILLYLIQLPEELLASPPTPTRLHAQFQTIEEET